LLFCTEIECDGFVVKLSVMVL